MMHDEACIIASAWTNECRGNQHDESPLIGFFLFFFLRFPSRLSLPRVIVQLPDWC